MLHYILQVIVFQLLFLLIYEFLLKKETFFSYNRWYLLVTPVIALLLPLLKFETLGNLVPAESLVLLPEVVIGKTSVTETSIASTVASGFQMNWWLLIYSGGIVLGLILFFRKYFSLKRMFSYKIVSEEKTFKIIEIPNSNVAYTFFNTIFLGEQLTDDEKQQIFRHEMVHVQQKHSWDLVFFELFKIVFWFNPLIYIFQHKIAALHEFIADAQVVASTEKKVYYQQLLNTAFGTQNISFINQFFNHSLIKKRIIMLQKSKSKSVARLKYLVLVPLLLVMMVYVSCSKETEEPTRNVTEETSVSKNLEEIKAAIESGRELTAEEKNQLMKIIGSVDFDKVSPSFSITKSNSPGGTSDVPFSVIEDVPVYPGCEDLATNKARKECMSDKITEFVSAEFNVEAVKPYVGSGVNKVYVQFRITKTGEIEITGVRGPNSQLEAEARRVISELPDMIPGKQDGKAVGVLYSLPIQFMNE